MPGRHVSPLQRKANEYEMFVAKLPNRDGRCSHPADWRKARLLQTDPILGGYFGRDADRPVFVFSKGRGSPHSRLPEK